MFGQFPQTPGDLYDDPTDSHDDKYHRQNIGRITFGAGPGDKANKTGTIQ
jgi:hypothetical protein